MSNNHWSLFWFLAFCQDTSEFYSNEWHFYMHVWPILWIPFFIVHLITFCIFYCDKENLFDINSNFTTTTYFIVMASYELLDLHFCLNDPKYKNDILMNQHHIGAIFSSLIILSVGESDLFNNEITSFYAVYCSLLGSSNILMNLRYFVILLCSNKMINLVNYLFAGYFLVVRVVVGNIFGVI